MKKLLIIVLGLLLLFTIIFYSIRRTPYTTASAIAEFEIPSSLNVIDYDEKWNQNMGGDGESLIVFSFDYNNRQYLIQSCRNSLYDSLPIKNIKPEHFVPKQLNIKANSGYYLYKSDNKDPRDFKLVILDLNSNKLFIYNILN